jgi:8-amino-7-oxononanoate synthase
MNGGDELHQRLVRQLDERRQSSQLRCRRVLHPLDPVHVQLDGKTLVNFASNNYLGLTHHPRIISAAREALEHYGAGSGAAALISGYAPAHASVEQSLARWKGTQAAVLLPSGYQANFAAIQTLAATGECRFLIDKLAHASLIDAVRASGSPFRVFPHNHLGKLQRLLEESEAGQLQIVVTESIFSMDGDAADLAGLVQLKNKFPFALLLDEAHGSGVYGPCGSGYAAECGLQKCVDVSVVTLSKAMGVGGGAVCASQTFCDALINFGRASIYSTNISPVLAAAAEAAIQVLHDEPQRQLRLRNLAGHVRGELTAMGFSLPSGDSPILPIILGSDEAALRAASDLLKKGMVVLAIRPPTVAAGTSRLRITLSCEHSDEEIEQMLNELRGMKSSLERFHWFAQRTLLPRLS